MKLIQTLTALVALIGGVATLVAQQPQQPNQPTAPQYHQTISSVKVPAAKRAEYMKLMETNRKVAEARIAAGEIISWTLLRAVMPAGEEARSDFMISILSEGLAHRELWVVVDRVGK